jgi:hypothetical protein
VNTSTLSAHGSELAPRAVKCLLSLAARSSKHIVAVTHVRNVLATPTILVNGDNRKIPVRGGAKTGAIVWVEKSGGRWAIREDEGYQLVAIEAENSPLLS